MKKSSRLLRWLAPMIGGDASLRLSRRGVPHVIADIGRMNISVCYFMSSGKYKVWTGCGTDNNVLIAEVDTPEEVVEIVKGIM